MVFAANVLAEAAMIRGIEIHIAEIHGLSQRGGTVTVGIGIGKGITGFTGRAQVDVLLGLEPLETQRCLPYLHRGSSVLFGHTPLMPYAVNAQSAKYPDIPQLAEYLRQQCKEVLYVADILSHVDRNRSNLFLLGAAAGLQGFPFDRDTLELAIIQAVPEHQVREALRDFEKGIAYLNAINTYDRT